MHSVEDTFSHPGQDWFDMFAAMEFRIDVKTAPLNDEQLGASLQGTLWTIKYNHDVT